MTLSNLVKYSMTWSSARSLCNSWASCCYSACEKKPVSSLHVVLICQVCTVSSRTHTNTDSRNAMTSHPVAVACVGDWRSSSRGWWGARWRQQDTEWLARGTANVSANSHRYVTSANHLYHNYYYNQYHHYHYLDDHNPNMSQWCQNAFINKKTCQSHINDKLKINAD